MGKAAGAFRTITEVSDWLSTPAHVLRFWESKFAQVKPVKRGGGRRYYRPADMRLLGGIRELLHVREMPIKDAQKAIRAMGVRAVMDMSPPLPGEAAVEAAAVPHAAAPGPLALLRADMARLAAPDLAPHLAALRAVARRIPLDA
ncbi:MAG: MerR family transcriptional regulator [Paracoccaceae bacterium]